MLLSDDEHKNTFMYKYVRSYYFVNYVDINSFSDVSNGRTRIPLRPDYQLSY